MTAPRSSDRSAWLGWLLIVAGWALGLGWLILSVAIGDTIEVENLGGAMALRYAIVFAPLFVIALIFGQLGQVRVLRAGKSPGLWLILGLLLGGTGLGVTVVYSLLNGGLVPSSAPGVAMTMISLGAALTLVQVAVEEVFFRGWLQQAIDERAGSMAAAGLSSIGFAVFHLPAGVTSPISAVTLMLGGVFFGLLALRSGGILASVGAHFAWNAIEDQGLGLLYNPGNGMLGSFTDYELLGSALWGGTEEGLNASIGTVIVLAALILPLLRQPAAKATAAA